MGVMLRRHWRSDKPESKLPYVETRWPIAAVALGCEAQVMRLF